MKLDKRNKLLAGGLLLLLVLSYYLALDKTLVLRRTSQELSSEAAQFSDISGKLAVLQQKQRHYDSLLVQMNMDDSSLQNNLLKQLNRQAALHDIKVMDFNPAHTHESEGTRFDTYSFDLRGNYTDILKVLYDLEQKGNYGEIVHLAFEKKKDYRTRRYHLDAMVFVQQLQ